MNIIYENYDFSLKIRTFVFAKDDFFLNLHSRDHFD